MQRKLELLFKFVAGLTFFVPLAFFPSSFIFPFIVPKVVIFRSLVLLMLGIYIVLLSMNWHRYRPKMTPITIVVLLFILSFGVSTFAGLDWYRSFWDNHERMLGMFTIIHYVAYYLMLTSVVKSWDEWKWLLRTFLLGGGIVMIIAVIQQFNHTFLLNTSDNRSASTLGNPIYVGGYGLFLFSIGWLMTLREKNVYWKSFVGIVGVLGFFGVFFSGSRGALVGLVAAIGILILSYIVTLKGHNKVRNSLIAVLIFCVVLMGTLYAFRKSNFVTSIPTVGHLLNTTIGSIGTRVMAWEIAVEAWEDHPIVGWGPGNYYFAFNKYYRPEFLRYGYAETWFDNAHNIVLNTLAERGAVGAIIYLGLFFVSIFGVWKLYKEKPDKINIHFLAVVSAFLIAHLVQTISVFDNPTSYMYFFFFLAFANSTIICLRSETEEYRYGGEVSLPVVIVSSLLVIFLVYTTNVNPARANMATLQVLRGVYSRQDIQSLYQTAVSIPTPHIDDIRNDVARGISPALRDYVSAGKPELAQKLFQIAYKDLEKNRELHPFDLRVYAQEALLLQEAASLSGDKSLLLEAEKLMEDGLAQTPKRQQFIYTLAGLKIQLNKVDEAESLYLQAINDYEMIGESWWRLALLKSVFGKTEEAVAIINEAKEKGISFGTEGDPVVASILAKYGEETSTSSAEVGQ